MTSRRPPQPLPLSMVTRLLHRRSELGYTTSTRYALPGAGEAPDPDQLERITDQAQQRARERQRQDWQASRNRLKRELDWLYSQRYGRDVRDQLRAVERQITRLDDKIGRRL